MISYAIHKKGSLPAAMAEPEHDVELVRLIAAGDEPALRELYLVYGQRLYAYALRLTDDPALAEDVVQEALVAVWRTAGRYRGQGRVLAWLLGIIHHMALKSIRRRTKPTTKELEDSLPATAASPEEQTQASEQARWVRHGLEGLSSEHRAVLELVFYQGLSLEEVAQVCSCPLGTVKSRLSYARRHLRGELSRHNLEDWR
jgi:RNA polymerase sigma-70 factor (ECF subfamily)